RNVSVELTDGSQLVGTVPEETVFPMESDELKSGVAIKWVDSITLSADHATASLALLNGDQVNGRLSMKALPMTTAFGKVALDLQFVKSVNVREMDSLPPQALVFSNSLASENDALRSAVGPPLKPFAGADAQAASRDYTTGRHGAGAVTIKGDYQAASQVRNLVLDGLDKLVNPERGCIEFWYCQMSAPVAGQAGVYRMFDGKDGLGSCASVFATPDNLEFALDCGGTRRALDCAMQDVPLKQWMLVSASWDRKGLDHSPDTLRLYINGKKVASSTAADWGNTAGGSADVCGSANAACAGKFYMNGLKIWSSAKTVFDTERPPRIDPKNIKPPEGPAWDINGWDDGVNMSQ
ncbi:MAG TPA: LamG-like jellyroll fold domain-containing protein, partial [Chthoniobacteraceae bacterium]|nr:LamG-like jellyroll fold domain-containing protein [Chthoniobacteraceae bacterium]